MPAPRNDALARFVLAPTTKKANGRSLDQQWNDLAAFLKGPASTLARWMAIGQMHSIYKRMRLPERREKLQTIGKFVESACRETGLSGQSIYNYVERARTLVEVLGPTLLKSMLSGSQTIANDENLLIKVAQLPPAKAVKVVQTYMRGGKGEASAARLVETYLHEHRLSGLSTHQPQLRGGSLIEEGNGSSSDRETSDARNVVYFGDALVHLRESIAAGSVQTSITSPPFFGQRDFGTRHWFGGDPECRHDRKVAHGSFRGGDVAQATYKTSAASEVGQKAVTHSCSKCAAWYGQVGQEPDVGMYIDHLVAIFGAVRRVLREDGVCWIEIGDTFNAYNANRGPSPSLSGRADHARPRFGAGHGLTSSSVPNKSLMLVPQRLALALLEDGWIVRGELVWQKTAGLPESVTDRPTRTHTTILMLAKNPDYFYDHVAVMEPTTGTAHARGSGLGRKEARPGRGNKANMSFHTATAQRMALRHCRDVWSLPVGRFPESHTATFPPALPERCIRASTSERGACAKCKAPWRRIAHSELRGGNRKTDGSVGRAPSNTKYDRAMTAGGAAGYRQALRAQGMEVAPPPVTIGWEPTCECGVRETVPCIVLDPFAGSGTTLMVAKQLGRDYVGIELNEREYRPLIERRLAEVGRPREKRTRRAARTSARRS